MQAVTALAADYRLRLHSPISKELGLFVIETEGRSVAETIALLQRDGRVGSVSPNYIMRALRTPNDPRYPEQWHYPQISAPQAWNLTTGATDRVVAVVDSGLDVLHTEFAGRVVPGYDFVLNTTTMTDPDGHGTHVAGTVGAATNNSVGVAGVDWNARIMPVRVLDATGAGTTANITRGILFSAGICVRNSGGTTVCPGQQAQVINLSLGLPNRTDPGRTCQPMPETGMRHPIAFALATNSVIVAAAGNDACGVVGAPANYPGVIAVAATTRTNSVALYSNWGSEIWIAAPGGDTSVHQANGVLSTLPGNSYGWAQGTSMAAPHVAGVASLMLGANRDLTPWEVKLLLAATATDLAPAGWDPDFGFGLIHAQRAVQLARDSLTARHSDFIVRIRSGANVVAQTRADPGGNFTLENIPAGSYIIEAGTDVNRNGVLGDPGEFLGSVVRDVAYTGDLAGLALNVTAR
jgi:serine protease